MGARFELGRQPANTKLSSNVTIRKVRCRGGNYKFRALRLDTGNFSWGSEVRRQLTLLHAVCQVAGLRSFRALVSFWLNAGVLCLQAVTRKTRVLDVVYNASNNELVRSDASGSYCEEGLPAERVQHSGQ